MLQADSVLILISFQARIGNMDGVLVAYHNTSRIFGFQYIPLAEMDARLFGDASRGERVFNKCVSLLEEVLVEAIACFPDQVSRNVMYLRLLTDERLVVCSMLSRDP
jgi:hypothetical protein